MADVDDERGGVVEDAEAGMGCGGWAGGETSWLAMTAKNESKVLGAANGQRREKRKKRPLVGRARTEAGKQTPRQSLPRVQAPKEPIDAPSLVGCRGSHETTCQHDNARTFAGETGNAVAEREFRRQENAGRKVWMKRSFVSMVSWRANGEIGWDRRSDEGPNSYRHQR